MRVFSAVNLCHFLRRYVETLANHTFRVCHGRKKDWHFLLFYRQARRNHALALRRCYADATPAFVRTYDAFAALKPALV